MAKLGRKEKQDRNKLLVQTKEENPSITYRQLGEMFNITRGRACQIYTRYKNKYNNQK